MTSHKSDFINTVAERGFLHQCTDLEALDALAAKPPLSAYIGFDCTAPSLHAGSLVSIMLLRLLQNTGHKPIVLIGGGTTKVGDPSGKDKARKFLGDDEIAANMASIRDVFAKFLTFGDGPTDAMMINNADWLDGLSYIPFLRDYGRYFSVNRMLGLDSVKTRLERQQPLSFLEFNYMVLQAYDFLELARRHDCVLQMGGSAIELSKWQKRFVEASPDMVKARRRVQTLDPETRFALPTCVRFDAGRNRLYVVDSQRWRIQIFDKLVDYAEPQFNI